MSYRIEMKRVHAHEVYFEFIGGVSGYTLGNWDYGLDRAVALEILQHVRKRRTEAAWMWVERQ